MRKKLITIFILISMILALTGCIKNVFQPQNNTSDKVGFYSDIVYKKGLKNQDLALNIALPKEASNDNKVPLIILVHPGTWSMGDKDDFNDTIRTLSDYGYAAASIDYGLIPDENMLSQSKNLVDSIKFIVENGSDKGIDKDKVILIGASAGGHLAILAAQEICNNKQDYDFNLIYLVDMFGATDLNNRENLSPDLDESIAYLTNSEFLIGDKNMKVEDAIKKVNPIEIVNKNLTKTLVISGDQDDYIPIEISKEFYERLQDLGVDSEFVEVKGVGHSPLNEEFWKEIFSRLEEVAK